MQIMPQINRRVICLGLLFVAVGLAAPGLISVRGFGIFELMERSLINNSSGDLLMTSLRLVILNTLRALPHYTGALLIAEGMGLFRKGAPRYLLLLPVSLIPAVYLAINLLYGISYDFGTPAIGLILVILIVNKMENLARHVFHKILVFALLLFGVQWLDIVPGLTRYWFGRGEISMDIKHIAAFMGVGDMLTITGLALFVICVANSFILAGMLSSYTRRIHFAEQAQLASLLQMRMLENRSLREMQSLVHDLKTPLTTIQGLAGVLALSDIGDMNRDYAKRISEAGDKMSTMISELLKDEVRQTINAAELVKYAAAHVPALSMIEHYSLSVEGRPPLIRVNKIKMARAIINLLENSLEAIDASAGRIVIIVRSAGGNALLTIEDNGPGILPDQYNQVWEVGFSTKNSSGLGLPFVREVVEKNDGTIEIQSVLPKGTRMMISIPEVSDERQ